MKKLAQKTFTADLVREGSWGVRELGQHASTLTLYEIGPGRACIEWDIAPLDAIEEIGLWFDEDKNLTDYDGIFSLPREAIELLRENGFTVGEDFE